MCRALQQGHEALYAGTITLLRHPAGSPGMAFMARAAKGRRKKCLIFTVKGDSITFFSENCRQLVTERERGRNAPENSGVHMPGGIMTKDGIRREKTSPLKSCVLGAPKPYSCRCNRKFSRKNSMVCGCCAPKERWPWKGKFFTLRCDFHATEGFFNRTYYAGE